MNTITKTNLSDLPTRANLIELATKVAEVRQSDTKRREWRDCPSCRCACCHFEIGGEWVCIFVEDHLCKPEVGMPATILLYTDTVPAVVTKVTNLTVTVVEVADDKSTARKGHGDNDTLMDGDLSKPLPGTECSFRWNAKRHGLYNGGWQHGLSLRLGRSRRRIDWTF